jgi:multidrug efflux system membrane fusion protein
MVDEGNLVRGTDISSGIVMITEVRPIAVIFTLPQQQLAQINAASARGPVPVEALDADGKTVIDRGSLQVVDNQVDQATGTVRMKAEFANVDLQLWPGQFVNVRVLIDTLKQVVVIPTPAVQRGPNGTFAYVVEDQRVALRPITVGLQTETAAVVAKGIAPAERVVTTGFARLKHGARVSVARNEESEGAAGQAAKGGVARAPARADTREKMHTPCAVDAAKLCANVDKSREAIRACLTANAAQLSDPCKAATTAQGRGEPREADARNGDGSATR